MQKDPNLAFNPATNKIPRTTHQPTPGSAAPTTANVQHAQAAQPRSQPASTANNANAGAAQAPVPGVRAGQHARVNHLPYGQVLGGQYGGAQGRRPVPQHSAGPPQAFYQHYGNNLNHNNINPYTNSYMGNPSYNSMASYPPAAYYSRGPTAPVAQSTIGTGPQIPTRDFQSQTVGAQPRVQVPPKRSKAIPIVNPDTKEEVKISKASQPKTASVPQVSPPIRKPLEVVAPSEVSDSTELAGDTHSANKSKDGSKDEMKTEPVKETAQVAAKVVAGAEEASNPSAPSTKDKAASPVTTLVDQKTVSVCSDLSENKVDMAEKELASVPVVESAQSSSESKATAQSTTSEAPRVAEDNKCEANSSDISASAESAPESVPTPHDDSTAVKPEDKSVDEPKEAEKRNESAVEVPASESDASAKPDSDPSPAASNSPAQSEPTYSSPPKRSRPISPQWTEGQRRVYPIPFLRSMKEYADESSAESYNSKLKSFSISTSQRGAGQQGSGRRGGRGYGSDPRGRVVEPNGGYNAARGGGVLGGGGYNMSDFDLSGARNRAPPPHANNRSNYDPRGSRNQDGGRGSRSYGPVRGGVGPLDPYQHLGPVEKLARSDNHWARKKEADSVIEAKTKQMKSLLNKLTIEKFEKITSQILAVELSSPEECQAIVAEIFEKVLFEPKFASMYAMLCKQLDISTREMFDKFSTQSKTYTFRKVLLKLCQVEFQKKGIFKSQDPAPAKPAEGAAAQPSTDKEAAKPDDEKALAEKPSEEDDRAKAAAEEEARKKTKAKRRMLANLCFIGELFLVDLISEKIIHMECVQTLLRLGINEREEDVFEALCKLLSSTGKKLSAQNMPNRALVPQYFEKIVLLSQDGSLPKRSRYMLMDLVDLRNKDWVPRRKEDKAKKIKEIHEEIAREEQRKAQMQARGRHGGRGHGSGGGGRADSRRNRGSSGSQPSMNMTMASQRTSSQTNRANSTLERFAILREGRPAGNDTMIRLGPGASRSSGNGAWNTAGRSSSVSRTAGNAAGSGAQLRPQRTGFDILAGNDSAAPNPGGRRGNKFSTLSTQKASSPAETLSKGPELMTDESCKKKAKSAMTEYWETHLDDELKAVVETEVGALNAPKFIEGSLRAALNEKIALRPEGVPYFKCLITNTLITAEAMATGFAAVLEDLDNIVVDDPRAGEFVAMYLAAVFGTGKLGSESSTGLGFVKYAMINSTGKAPIKFIVHLLDEIRKMSADDSDEIGQNQLRDIYLSLGVDLFCVSATMYPFPIRGFDYLEDLLKEKKLCFILPNLRVEKVVVDKIQNDVGGEDILSALSAMEGVEDSMLKSASFLRAIILGSFALFFDQFCGAKDIENRMKAGLAKLCNLIHEGIPPVDVQYAVLLAVHDFLHKVMSKAVVPELDAEHKGKNHSHLAFERLYDEEIIDEDTFMKWKSDESETVMSIGNKDKILLQTASWFQWLATAEEAS